MFLRLSIIAFGFSLLVSCTVSSNNEQLLLDEIGVLQDRVHELEKELENNSVTPLADSPTTTEAVGSTTSSIPPSTTVVESTDSTPKTSPLLTFNGDVFIPDGSNGELSVVLLGTPNSGGSVPIVVRNRTGQTYVGLEANGIARNGEGELIASGSSQGFTPTRLHPGEWAFGYVYFGSAELDENSDYEITVSGNDPNSWTDSFYTDLQIVEFNQVDGTFERQVVGLVKNQTDSESDWSLGVNVICFDSQGRNINSTNWGSVDASDSLSPGAVAPFGVGIGFLHEPDDCPIFAMGVH
jgi:hypothetical protein